MLATSMTAREVWTSQCEVAREILADSGAEHALDYLIGEKFLNFLAVAEDYPAWRDEISDFVAEIKDIFDGWQIIEYFHLSRQRGVLVSVGGAELRPLCSAPPADEMTRWVDVWDRTLLARARAWLADDVG